MGILRQWTRKYLTERVRIILQSLFDYAIITQISHSFSHVDMVNYENFISTNFSWDYYFLQLTISLSCDIRCVA